MAEEISPPTLERENSQEAYKWPNSREDYELMDVLGSGATSVVHVARCIPNNQKVAIKRIDLEQCGATIEELQREIGLMSNCNHPNVDYYNELL